MAARSVSVREVKSALAAQNVELPSGQIKGENRNYTVITKATAVASSTSGYRNDIFDLQEEQWPRKNRKLRIGMFSCTLIP